MENLSKIKINIINKFVKYFNRKFKNGNVKIAFLLKPSGKTHTYISLLVLFKDNYGWNIDNADIDNCRYFCISKYIDENKIIGEYKTAWFYPICEIDHLDANISDSIFNHTDENNELNKLQLLLRKIKK